jgi:hypothetical protein
MQMIEVSPEATDCPSEHSSAVRFTASGWRAEALADPSPGSFGRAGLWVWLAVQTLTLAPDQA